MSKRKRWIEPALLLAAIAALLSLFVPKDAEVEELGFSLRPVVPVMQLEAPKQRVGFGLGLGAELRKFEPMLGAYDFVGVYPLEGQFPTYDPTRPMWSER